MSEFASFLADALSLCLLEVLTMKHMLLIALLATAASVGVIRGADRSFSGEIMDSQCAQMSSHVSIR